MKRGIDVAKWQGTISWPRVQSAGVEFAVLKIIDKTGNTEGAFERNYTGATYMRLPVGVYNYSYATTVAKAQSDARKVLEALKGRKLQCKVWLDVEDNCQKGLGRKLADIINAYKTIIEGAGYEFGVYTGLSFYNSYIKPYAALISCPFWVARYPSSQTLTVSSNPAASKKPSIVHPLWGWQFSSKGSVPGISGNVDLNIMYADIGVDGGPATAKNPYTEPSYTLYRYRIGMSKEYVRWLQCELNEMGYGLAVDGLFGKATDAALRSAQRKFGIVVDGKCGPETRQKLKKAI